MSGSTKRLGALAADGWARPAWTGLVTGSALGMIGVLMITLALGILFGLEILPKGPWFYPESSSGAMMLAWDGGWYEFIARNGYSWNSALGTHIGHFQSVAFFPLYSLIEGVLTELTGSRAPWLMALPGLLFGIASIPPCLRLAQRLLPASDAIWATLLYAAYPAANFLLMGYPTGLMNLLAILALLDIIDRRRWRAALWCGIGTAAGPPLVFVAVALCADQGLGWLRGRMPPCELPRLIGFSLLSVSGLLAYIAYQWIALGDPLAFIASQSAWGSAPRLVERLERLTSPHWYLDSILPYAVESFHALATLHVTQLTGFMIQRSIGKVFVLLAAAGALAAFRIRPLVVPFSGLCVLLGYLWFIDTIQNATSAPRLLFPAIPMFFGWALLLRRMPLAVRAGAVLVFASLLVLQTGLALAGYWVV